MSSPTSDQVATVPEGESEATATSTTEPMIEPDPSSETDESEAGASVASPIIAVEVDADGDVRLEDHEDQRRPEVLSSTTTTDNTETITPASDLTTDLSRSIWIVTTAALPWRTGTAVNPLLRALFLAQQGRPVTLVIPWLADAASRQRLYGAQHTFHTRDDQAAWIREYCVERCNCTQEQTDRLRIRFWEGAYNETFGSIFPVVDICATIPADEADICVLEEPEHLNWFRVINTPEAEDDGAAKETTAATATAHGDTTRATTQEDHSLGWASKFRHVVGILHTNYGDYVRQYGLGFSAPALNSLSSLVVKAYCHRLIRLSATLPHLDPPKEVTCNVHGVRPEFLAPPIVADRENVTNGSDSGDDDAQKKSSYAPVYFIGKLIWAKGFEKVLELQEKYKAETKSYFSMDVYGAGQDEAAIQKAFFGRRHAATQNAMSDESSSNKAKVVFEQPMSLRDQLSQNSAGGGGGEDKEDVLSTGENSANNEEDVTTTDLATTSPPTAMSYDDEKKMCDAFFDPSTSCTQSEVVGAVPLEILGDISGKTYSTSIETAGAALRLIDSVISVGFEGEGNVKKSRGEALLKTMASAKTRFKVRFGVC